MTELQIKTYQTPGAVIYTRVSTGEQDKHGTSPETQLDACRKKAQALGLPIVAEYHDGGVSGGFLLTRTEFQAALTDLREGRADTLICPNISRYSRDVEHQQAVKKAVKAAGRRLVFCDMTFEDTPEGDLNFTIQGGFAEYEKAVIRKRTMSGKAARAEGGIQTARTYSPFGYHIVGKADVLRGDHPADLLGKYLIAEDQAALVREMFTRYAEGQSSLSGLARLLNERGIPTRLGAAFWSASTVSYILSNPVYKGVGVFGRSDYGHDENRLRKPHPLTGRPLTTTRTQKPADPATWITWDTPALVSEEVWEAVQVRGRDNKKKMSGNPTRVRMLAGRVFCPHCGAGIVCALPDKRRGQTEAQSYVCGRRVRAMRNAGLAECRPTYYPIAASEQAVLLALQDACHRSEVIQEALNAYAESLPVEAPAAAPDTAALRAELAALEKKQGAAVEAQIAGIMAGAAPAAYNAVFASLAARRTELEALLAKSTAPAGKPTKPSQQAQPTAQLADILTDVERVLTSPQVTGPDKRDALGSIISRVYPQREGAKIEFLPGVFSPTRLTPEADVTLQGLPKALICAGLSAPDCSRNKTL